MLYTVRVPLNNGRDKMKRKIELVVYALVAIAVINRTSFKDTLNGSGGWFS